VPSNNRIHIVNPEPTIEEMIDRIAEERTAQFASELDTARVMWQNYPALVEAPDFPQELLGPLRSFHEEPGESTISDDCMKPGFRAKVRAAAIKYLRGRRRSAA
jgi:hypothetical protein